MARLLIKAKVERKDPEESRLINAFSEAVKAVRSYAISRDIFVYQYNEWCQKIQPNITFLNESYQIFLERTSPSTLQRFFVTTFAAVCFLESIRNKNADCFFIGVFFCFLLILMSFITAIIGLLSTTPDKSAKSILNWILTMNVLSKEISHRLNRTSRVFQIIAGPDMLYTNSRETNHHTISRWNYFFRLFFLNFLYWFSIYGTAFAVQVCVILKVLSFMEMTEVLKSFSLFIIFINSLIQDIKIRRIRREIHYQICCLDSETENFLSCFHDRSNLGPLLEQYEFLKEPLLNTLKCGNDFDKITSSHSFILFAITVIKVSDGLQDSIYSENLQTILQCLLFNDPNMCSKTKVELISDKTPDIPSVLQTTKDLADCFLQLGTVLKESKLASSIPVESKKENKSSAILQKILNPKEILPAEKNSSKKQLKKSKIPKKIPEDLNRHSVGNKKDKLNKISDTVTKDRHIKENESENTLKITSKVAESEDFDSEKNKPLTSLDILPSSLLVMMEKPQEIDLNPESEVDNGDTCTINSDIKENKKRQNFLKSTFKATESDGFNSEENKLPTSLNDMPSPLLATMEKHERFDHSPKSEANYGDALMKNSEKMKSENNKDLQNEQSNPPKDLTLHSSLAQEVLNRERENEQSNLLKDMILHSIFYQEVPNDEGKNEQLNRPKDVILHSTLVQEVVNDEEENEQSNLSNDMVLHSSLVQKVLSDEGENEDSSIPENTVLHSRHTQEISGEESNTEIPSPVDDTVLHSPLVRKDVDENENKTVPAPEETDLSETNQNASIPFQNAEHDDMKIGVSCRTRDTDSDSRAISNALDKDDSDGQTAENKTVVENFSPVNEIKIPLIPSKEEGLLNDLTSASSSIKQTNGKKDVDFAQQSRKGDNIGRIEHSETTNGRASKNKTALKEALVKTDVAISKRNFMTVNPDFNQDIVTAETDETANANFKNSDETFHTIEDESSSAMETHPNPEVRTPEKIHLQEIKLEGDDFEAGILESGRDKNVKSIYLDKTFIDQSNSLSYIGFDGKSITNHQNGYQQSVEDNKQNLHKTVSEEILLETIRNFFEHQNLVNRQVQMPIYDTSKQNQESITYFKDIKGKSNETILHQDTDVYSHPKNASLRHEAPYYFAQANTSAEGDDKADLELSRRPYLKTRQLKLRAKSVLKSKGKQRKRKTLSGNNSVLEDPSADVSGSEKSIESNDAKSATSDNTSTSNTSNFGELSIENQESAHSDHLSILNSMLRSLSIDSQKILSLNNSVLEDPSADVSGSEKSIESNDAKSATSDNTSTSNMSNFGELSIENQESAHSNHLSILNSMMRSLSIDSQKQEPSNNQNNSNVVNEEKKLKSKSNFFSFGSTELLVDDSEKEKPSNNILERGPLESLGFPIQGLDKLCVEQNSKEKEKTSNKGSNTFIFGIPKLPMNDSEKPSKNILERNRFHSYATANKDHHGTDFSKEKEKTSNNTSNAFVFGSPKLPMNDSKKPSKNILERNRFDSYATANKDHHGTDFGKEKEKTSNNTSNAFVFGSPKLPMNDSKKPSKNILERNRFDSYATANKDHHGTDFGKEKEKTSNNTSNAFVFGSPKLPMNDSEKPSKNILERNRLDSYATANKDHHGTDFSKEKEKTSNNTSNAFVFGSPKLPMNDSEKPSKNILERNRFDSYATANKDHHGTDFGKEKEKTSNNTSNAFVFGSPKLPMNDSEKPSKNILERNRFDSYATANKDHHGTDFGKEKEKTSNNTSNAFVFGSPKSPMNDSEKPSKHILERNRFDSYANANKDHHGTDFSKENEKTSNNTSNALIFGIPKLPMNDSEKPSKNILERNRFDSYATANKDHHGTDLKQFSNEGSYNWWSEQNSKEKEKTSNNKSNNSLLGSTQLSMKDPIQEKLSYMSFRFPFESFATANKVHHKTALQESPVDGFEKSCVEKYSEGKENISNSKSKFSEFSSTESSTKDSEKEELYNNSFQRSLFENFTNKMEDSAGFCGQEFPKGSLSKRNVEQNSDPFAFINSFMETFSKEPDQHNASNKTEVLLKSIKNKETKSGVKTKTLEENNASSNGMVTDPPKISAATLTTSEEEIENQAERNMRKAIQKLTFGDFVFESTIPSNQLSFNPTFDLYSHKEDKSYTGKENEFFDSYQNGHSNQEETQSSNDKVNKTCNGIKSEIFNDEANGPYNGKTNGPSNSQANEHFSNKENESCRHEEKESSSKIENGQCKGQRYQYSSNKEMELFNSEKNKPFSREENRYPDSKHDEPLNDEENKSDADIQIVLCNGQAKQISNNIENKPYSFQENESYSEMIENASPDGKLNNMNAEENVPSIVQGNQTSSNKENKPCSSEENRPCSGIEIASPEGKQNKSLNAEENGPRSENGNHISSNNEIKPYSSEENGPCIGTENATPGGKQNKSLNAEENGPRSENGNHISSNNEIKSYSSEENGSCIGTENATPGGKQNKSLNAEENGPRSENGNHISSNNEIKPYSSEENGSCIGTENATPGGKQNKSLNAEKNGPRSENGNHISSNNEIKSYSSEENGPCIGTEKATPGGKQNKPFNAEENGPISDQGNQLSSNKEDKSCSFLENGPYSGVENASTHGKQNKSVNAEENASSSYPEKPTSINKESGHFNAEANQSYIAGENEPYNPEGNEFHSSESNVRSSDENESFSDEENEFCDAQENGPWNDKEKEIFDAKGNKPCSIVQKEPCNNEMYEPCRGGENQTYKVEENKKVSSLLKESPTNISSNTNDEQSFSAECFFSKEGSELRNSQDSEAIQAETETLVNSTNGSAGLRVPTRADLKNMTEKEPHSLESSATSELKNETFILSESEVLLKNDEAVKERMTSRQSQKMQTHHAEIPDASPDADNLNQSNMQSKKGGEGADIMTDSGFCDTGRDISSLQKFRQNSESDTFQSNEDELGKERSSNNFEENSHLFVSDKNGTSTHLVHTLADANSSECLSSENKECNNFNTEGDLVLPEDSRMNSTQINENTELNQRFSDDENQRNIEHRSNNAEVADQYSGTVSEYAEYSLKSKPSKSVELPAADLAELSATKPAGLSTSEVAELTTSELPDSGHKKCSDFNSEDTSVLSEDYSMNSIHEDENTNLNLGLLFDENEYHVEHRSNNEEVAGQHSGTVSESAECSLETESSKPTELPDSEPSEFPTSKLVESSSSVQKECGDFQSEDTSMLSENCRMNSTQIDENRDLNLGFSFDENNHSNNEEVADQHSGIGSERDEYSSESKSPKSGILNKGSVKRFRKKHKIKERRSSGVKRDSSDSDSRQHTLWDSDLGSRVFQERAVQRSARKVSTSECIENECHIERHSNNEVVADQYSGTTSKDTKYSSSSESVIVPVNTSENGSAISEQNQIVSEQRDGYYTRDQAPVCSLRYKNLDVDIFPPLSRLKLKLVCQNNKTQTNSENNETRMSETSSVSQSMNSEDSLTSEFQSDDGSAEQNVSQEAVSQSGGVIKKYESKPLHFEDRNVSLNYSKRRASLNYSHSSSNGNEITFKSKNTKLYINTENIDQSE